MEFSASAKTNAVKFLTTLAATKAKPDEPHPFRINWPTIDESEVEADTLDIVKEYVCKSGCPGFLAYHLCAEVYHRLKQKSLAPYMAKETEETEGEDATASIKPPSKQTDDQEGEGGAMAGDTETPAKPKPPQVDSILLAIVQFELLLEVAKDWSSHLPPLTSPLVKPDLSFFAMKNTRRKMEDRHALCLDVNALFRLKGYPPQLFFGVYDGHAGVEAASYTAIHLLANVVRQPSFKTNPEEAMKEGFSITDVRFCQKDLKSGSTAVATLITGDKLTVGWLGDSQAYLIRKGKSVQLVVPHKPEQKSEEERIKAAGGMVLWLGAWRVNGNLSVSRAIGDVSDKKFVIGDADVESWDLDGSEDYLVVACDGIWDVMTGDEIVECVDDHFNRGGEKSKTAEVIVNVSKSKGSGDNMTCIVMFFTGYEPPAKGSLPPRSSPTPL